MKNPFKIKNPFKKKNQPAPIPVAPQASSIPPNNLPFDPVTYLQQENGLDQLLKLLIFPAVILSAWFTGKFLSNLWEFSSFDDKLIVIITAIFITALEVYTFRRYILKRNYIALVVGCAVSIISIMGSFGLFQTGFKKNEIKAEVMEIQKKKVKRLEKKSENFGEKKQIGNEWKAESEIDKGIKKLEKKAKDGVGSGNAVFESLASIFGTDAETASSIGNGFITIIIELGLILLTIWSAQEEQLKKKHDIAISYMFYQNRNSRHNDKNQNKKDRQKKQAKSVSTDRLTSENGNEKKSKNDHTSNGFENFIKQISRPKLINILYQCLTQKHENGQHKGQRKFTEIGKEYGVKRQTIFTVFDRFWKKKEDKELVAEVIRYIKKNHPYFSENEISDLTGLSNDEVKNLQIV